MRLLVDSDVFCKLGVSGMLPEAVGVLGTEISECGRLPALPHMLRRGKLATTYGPAACAALLTISDAMQAIPPPDAGWLDRLTSVHDIDPGEALLFATAAQDRSLVFTGDKRALLALKEIPEFTSALHGRIVVIEAILLALCERLGHAEVRRRLGSLTAIDKTLMVCFSPGNRDPRPALGGYYRALASEVQPLMLWDLTSGEEA
jgi:hypothetical protein